MQHPDAGRDDFLWEVRALNKHSRPKKVEVDSSYLGDPPSPLSFFYQFREVIFRTRGSVLPNVLIEVILSIGLAVVALVWMPDENFQHIGHQLVGVLLAFLIVFRSSNALSLYNEGRMHIGEVVASGRIVAVHMIEDVALALDGSSDTVDAGDGSSVFDAEEGVRLLKLFYYTLVEHVRSTDGCDDGRPCLLSPPPNRPSLTHAHFFRRYETWLFAQRIAYSFATPAEVEIFNAEFGPPQHVKRGSPRRPVIAVLPPGHASVWQPEHMKNEHNGLASSSIRLENRAARSEELTKANCNVGGCSSIGVGALGGSGVQVRGRNFSHAWQPPTIDPGKPHDPTAGKPLIVLMWLRMVLRRVERYPGEYDHQLNKLVSGSLASLASSCRYYSLAPGLQTGVAGARVQWYR